ncbi:MAG: hypothetical protein C4K49_11910 [Candidatus Thorarchaeota archaeon]|nr:MAG: hypothetical protein C4K49_11910 [Candidatus Thorarchaeota archaeon]
MSRSKAFEPVIETGWRMGFSNLARKELKAWFGTSAWWQQALMWTGALGLFSSIGFQEPETGLMIFYIMAFIFPSIAVLVVATGTILEEKDSGSAAWVLSKPVSRTAFVLAKLLPNSLNIAVSMVLIPGLVVFLLAVLFGAAPNILAFYVSLIPVIMWQMFLLFLTVCLGTFFEKAGSVVWLPIIFIFFGANLGMNTTIGPFGPWGLLTVATGISTGTGFSVYPLIITIVVLVALGAAAIWRFSRHEF